MHHHSEQILPWLFVQFCFVLFFFFFKFFNDKKYSQWDGLTTFLRLLVAVMVSRKCTSITLFFFYFSSFFPLCIINISEQRSWFWHFFLLPFDILIINFCTISCFVKNSELVCNICLLFWVLLIKCVLTSILMKRITV